MDLKMEVYSPALELLDLLEIHQSILWETRAFSSGSFSLNSLITEESRTLLVPENILWIAGEDAGIIEYIQQQAGEDGPYITVKGPDLTGLLARRILWGQYDLSGTVPEIMCRLVDECCIHPTRGDAEARKIPGLVLLDPPAGGPSVRVQKTGGNLLEALEGLGEAHRVAFGVRFNPAVPRMEFWTRYGVDRSIRQSANEPVFYSTELNDVLSSEYSYNAQSWRNVALVAGEGEGGGRAMITVWEEAQEPQPPQPEVTKYTVSLSVDPAGGGTASGAGTYPEGAKVTVSAAPGEGYRFASWREDGQTVSEDAAYEFTVSESRALTAVFEAVPSSRLPEGYTELAYIQSGGGQYIDTGVQPSAKLKTVVDVEALAESGSYGRYIVYSFLKTGTSTVYYYNYSALWTSKTYVYMAMGRSSSVTNKDVADIGLNNRVVITLDAPNKTGSVGETSVTFANNTTSGSMPSIHLFRSKTGTTSAFNGKLYACQMYSGGELVRDFVPCTNPTGAAGLYDLAEGKFYQSGSGTDFTPGPAV